MFSLPPSRARKIIQTWCVSNRLQRPGFALVAEPLQQLHLGSHRRGIDSFMDIFSGRGEKNKHPICLVSLRFLLPSNYLFQSETTTRLRSKWSAATETGSLRGEDGWSRAGKKHLLRCLSQALLDEILQQAEQLHLHVSAHRTLRFALASFLQDVGKTVAQDFSHEASVF